MQACFVMCAWEVDQMDYQSYRSKIWLEFLKRYDIINSSSDLFKNDQMVCEVKEKNKNNSTPILARHPSMENRVIEQVSIIEKDYISNQNLYEGLIYMMFTLRQNQLIPLYIGKTETFGKSNKNLSANIKNLKTNKNFFARWGDNYSYHIGDLSAVALNGHNEENKTTKYTDWAKTIFTDFPTDKPKLKIPVKFWCKAWKSNDISIWEEFGHANLTFLEYQLIGVASSLFPDDLLNKEGKNR